MKKSQIFPLRLELLFSSLVILCVTKPTYPAAHGKHIINPSCFVYTHIV